MATTKTKGKFATTIAASSEDIKGQRADILEKSVKKAAKKLADKIDDEIDTLETKLLNLSDLAPETTYSLRPANGKEFDADKWASDMFETRIQLALKKIELGEAEAILKEWF